MRTNARFLASLLAGLFATGVLLSACDAPDDDGMSEEDQDQESSSQPSQ